VTDCWTCPRCGETFARRPGGPVPPPDTDVDPMQRRLKLLATSVWVRNFGTGDQPDDYERMCDYVHQLHTWRVSDG
jgi:hypothetical protein